MERKDFFSRKKFERLLGRGKCGEYLLFGAVEILFTGDTAPLITAGMWVLVGEFLSIACSVEWATGWRQILVLLH